jgi:DNA segregation ATPase FtsK/SpoIIIE-like protein
VIDDNDDGNYTKAVALVRGHKIASIAFVQRKLRLGYNRSARLVERMEAEGVVSAPAHNGARSVLPAAEG